MRTAEQIELTQLIRDEFDPRAEVRFNKTCITVSLNPSFACEDSGALAAAVGFFLRDQNLPYTYSVSNELRFKLFEAAYSKPEVEVILADEIPDIDWDDVDDDDYYSNQYHDTSFCTDPDDPEPQYADDYFSIRDTSFRPDPVFAELAGTIHRLVEDAHNGDGEEEAPYSETQYLHQQRKKLEYDIEQYLTANLSAVLELTKGQTIDLDVLKRVMTLSFCTGLWYNARVGEVEVIADYIGDHFQFADEQYGEG